MNKRILIHSADRDSTSNSLSDYKFALNAEIKGSKTVKLIKAVIPRSFYGINVNNNAIVFDEGAATGTALITPGNYSGSTLAPIISSVLNGIGSLTYTTTYNSITGKFTITATGNFSFHFSDPTFTAKRALGFQNETINSTLAASLSSTSVIDLSGTRFLRMSIHGTGIGLSNGMASNDEDYSYMFPLKSSAFSDMIYDNNDFRDIFHWSHAGDNMIKFSVKITDDEGNIINFNGIHNILEFLIN